MNIMTFIRQCKNIFFLILFCSVIKIKNKWIKFNDSDVRELGEIGISKEKKNSKYIYNLFYEKK